MEAHTIHAAIEKAKKTTTAKMCIPRNWANFIRLILRQPQIIVHEMNGAKFLNFKSLLSTKFQHTRVNAAGEKVVWLKIRVIYYSSDAPGLLLYKVSFDPSESFKEVSLLRKKIETLEQ